MDFAQMPFGDNEAFRIDTRKCPYPEETPTPRMIHVDSRENGGARRWQSASLRRVTS